MSVSSALAAMLATQPIDRPEEVVHMPTGTMESPTDQAEKEAQAALDAEQAKLDAEDGGGQPAREDLELPADPSDGSLALSLGNVKQLSLHAGGKAPTSSSLRMNGGKVDLLQGTQFTKGDRVRVVVELVVDEVGFRDQKDKKTRQVVGAERKHVATIESVTLAD